MRTYLPSNHVLKRETRDGSRDLSADRQLSYMPYGLIHSRGERVFDEEGKCDGGADRAARQSSTVGLPFSP